MISNARSASGNIYPYFVCAGRHATRTNCTRHAILMDKVEQLVADHYKTIQIPQTCAAPLSACWTRSSSPARLQRD